MAHPRLSVSSEVGSDTPLPETSRPIPPSPHLPQRTPSSSSLHKISSSHRQSFAENLRNPPPSSPRSQRHPSFSQAAVQELMNHPPSGKSADPRFTGRDWRDVKLGELLTEETDAVKWADLDTSVEDATKLLLKPGGASVVLIEDRPGSKTVVSYFDYNDLNAYVLAVVGLAKPDEEQMSLYDGITQRAQDREPIPVRDIQPICRHEQLISLQRDDSLPNAIEVFGSGIHRIIVADKASQVVGVLSQSKVMDFFWNEGVNFANIERLYPAPLRDLQIGTLQTIAINADSPLAEALMLMSNEGLTSLAVVDNGLNVVGNISTVDVRLLTSAASLPLLQNSCMHFITVILSERGMEKGRDSVPVFYVSPHSTLAHTVAKLVATRSHRMWVVEGASPSPSAPATPLLAPVGVAGTPFSSGGAAAATSAPSGEGLGASGVPTVLMPVTSPSPNASTLVAATPPSPLPVMPTSPGFASAVPASAMAGAHLSGRLTGVVSLTDILNLFARSSGLRPSDPGEQRAMRRRSSSSSVRPSMESSRASIDIRR